MSKDILIDGGTGAVIKPERGDCVPEQWIEDSILIGRPIGEKQI